MTREEIELLLKQGICEGVPLRASMVETHISWVVLAREHVYKIKKPMRYSFLDYSSLESRAYYCRQEVLLNSRLTDIYLGVVPLVSYGDGLFSLGEVEGEVVDHAVKMRRMSEARRMDHMLAAGTVTIKDIGRLAEKISGFHREAEVIDLPVDKHAARKEFNDLLSVRPWVAEHVGTEKAARIQHFVTFSDRFLEKFENRMQQRVDLGFQRDVHGDLHSRNIFLNEDPVIFDCIEFNDTFRQIDVLKELAFFCMDLEVNGAQVFSDRFMENYLSFFQCLPSSADWQLFNYFKMCRANVRAKVNALRGMQSMEERERKGYVVEVRRYLHLMERYREVC